MFQNLEDLDPMVVKQPGGRVSWREEDLRVQVGVNVKEVGDVLLALKVRSRISYRRQNLIGSQWSC